MSDLPITYKGEAQLVRWAESGNAGRTVTLRLDEEGDVHPFKGLKQGDNGQRMQIVCVLVDDQEKPMAPPSAKKEVGKKAFRDMPRSQQAVLMLAKEPFQNWLGNEYFKKFTELPPDSRDETLKAILGIESKRQLNTEPAKAEAWDRLLASFDNRGYGH